MENDYQGMIDYAEVVRQAGNLGYEEFISFLQERLPYVWRDAYLLLTPRPTEIVRFRHGTFEYIFDDYGSLEARGVVSSSKYEQARLVVAHGRSEPRPRRRDDSRLRGWAGHTEHNFGKAWDKGHFIAHSLGGTVDGVEANVFVQRRDLNRGWSKEGRRFRSMEKYCNEHARTFCFARPIYSDGTDRPGFLEFGLIKRNGELWVECFDNQ